MHAPNVLQYHRKKVLCGALTNGHYWIFLLVKVNNNYDGASYKHSSVVQLTTSGSQPSFQPDLIAGILAYWVSLMLICKIELLIDWMLD
jgi:hypothetical protein